MASPTRAAILLVLGLVLSAWAAAVEPTLREPIAGWSGDTPAVAGVVLASGPLLAAVYRQREYGLAWDERRVAAFHRLLVATRRDGFFRGDFHFAELDAVLARGGLDKLPASQRATLDILLSDGLLRYIHHHRFGKVDPATIDPNWGLAERPSRAALERALTEALAASDLEAHLAERLRWPPFYRALRDGLARYRVLAEAGGWPSVADGAALKPGMRDASVPSIRARLRATGEYAERSDPAEPLLYDAMLQTAVERFQARHGLAKDGVVGPQTRAAMNVTVAQRIEQIRANLERMRWVSSALPKDFVLVDIAGYRVDLYRGGAVTWSTRAIVGRPDRMTPVFRDELAYIELNPSWTVPPTILAEDILPKMQEDPNYIYDRGLRVIDRAGRPVAPESVNWYLPAKAFPYMLRQGPGDDNALGRVKFMFPNRFSVYLHDTPEPVLFNRTARALSSGCVRVEEPLRLAELVLDDQKRWSAARLEEVLASRETRVVTLARPLPILLTYWTAIADGTGEVQFCPDIYARDEPVLRILDGGPVPLRFAAPPAPAKAREAQGRLSAPAQSSG